MTRLKKIKKIIKIFSFSAFLLLIVGLQNANAQAEDFSTVLQKPGLGLEKWITGNQEVGLSQRGIIDAVVEGLTVKLVGVPRSLSSSDQSQNFSTGALGALMTMTSSLYTTKPVSSANYVAYMKNQFGIAKPAYAVGEGWRAMQPILPLWKAMRNICYSIFAIIFVITGLTILLNKKLDAQTSVSIQNALPRIVIALILVTFSYALAGLMIDIAELATGIIATILNPFAPGVDNLLKLLNPRNLAHGQAVSSSANIFTLMGSLTEIISPIMESITDTLQQVPYIGDALKISFISVPIISLMIAITIVQSIIKTFFMLLSAYVSIILSTIFSPFVFLFSAFPSKSKGMGSWFKGFLSNTLIFPVTFALILFAAIIARPEAPNDFSFPLAGVVDISAKTENFSWSPAPFGVFTERYTGGSGPLGWFTKDYNVVNFRFVNYLMALGIIMMIPKAGEFIKSLVEGEGPKTAIGGGIEEGVRGAVKNVPIIGSFF